jgi:excisionase family DNA binding protein
MACPSAFVEYLGSLFSERRNQLEILHDAKRGIGMAGDVAEHVARLHHVESVMERLGVGRSKVFELMASGQLRSVKVGRRRLVSEAALVEFIEKLDASGSCASDVHADLDANTCQRTDDPRGAVV